MSTKDIQIMCIYDEMVPIANLVPHPKHRNIHPPAQIARLAKIYKYQGVRHPIIVSKLSNAVVAGIGRKDAAIKIGMTHFPVVYQDFESSEQEYAFIQSDNAIASWAELDFSGINLDIPDLGPDFDIDLLGIKNFKIEVMDKHEGQDSVPSVPKEATTKPGDIFQLGKHRLMCGDSTSIDDVDALMNGEKADITFTSPPYNLGSNAKLRGSNASGKDSAYEEKSDHKTQEQYLQFLKDFTALSIVHSKYAFINIQMLAGNKLIMSEYWNHFKNNVADIMIWDKDHAAPAMAPQVMSSVWEFIFIFADHEFPTRAIGTGKEFRGTLQNIYRLNPIGKKDELAKDHGAVFPVEFAEFFVDQFANESVIDFFGGSGTTMIAAEKCGKKSFLMELSPNYCDVIIERYKRFTGQQAVLLPRP